MIALVARFMTTRRAFSGSAKTTGRSSGRSIWREIPADSAFPNSILSTLPVISPTATGRRSTRSRPALSFDESRKSSTMVFRSTVATSMVRSQSSCSSVTGPPSPSRINDAYSLMTVSGVRNS